MIKRLRLQLTLWFVSLVMLLYAVGGFSCLMFFRNGLIRSVDVGLQELIAEITPSIQTKGAGPSLKVWAEQVEEQKSHYMPSVQIFDQNGRLQEESGPRGIDKLINGDCKLVSASGETIPGRSMYSSINQTGQQRGYLQVQVSTKPQEEAIEEFSFAMLVIAPFLALAVGAAGYVFAGNAVNPIKKTMLLLRRFVADAGHELNTPISTIEASLETIENPEKLGSLSPEVFKMLKRASGRLRELSSNLILLARIEDEETALPKESLDVKNLLEDAIAEHAPAAERKGLKLQLAASDSVEVRGHKESIYEVFSNLISNAVKYTNTGGEIEVFTNLKGANVEVSVRDTGIGIESENLPYIFDRFYRVDTSRTRAGSDSGLGLSIVKAAVKRHGGSVNVTSVPNSGTTFMIILPVTEASTRKAVMH